jgi:hypothetical protein
MTGLSIRVMPNFDSLKSKFVLTQSNAIGGTVHDEVLSADSADFDSMNC